MTDEIFDLHRILSDQVAAKPTLKQQKWENKGVQNLG